MCHVKVPGWYSDVLDIARNWDGLLFAWPSVVTFQLCLASRLAMVSQVYMGRTKLKGAAMGDHHATCVTCSKSSIAGLDSFESPK